MSIVKYKISDMETQIVRDAKGGGQMDPKLVEQLREEEEKLEKLRRERGEAPGGLIRAEEPTNF